MEKIFSLDKIDKFLHDKASFLLEVKLLPILKLN